MEDLKNIKGSLRKAEVSLEVAKQLLLSPPGSESEAVIHIARAWAYFARAKNITIESLCSDIKTIDKSGLSENLTIESWAKNILDWSNSKVGNLELTDEVPYSTVFSHIKYCSVQLRQFRKIAFREETARRNRLILKAVVAVIIIISIVSLVKSLTRSSHGWMMNVYQNQEFAGNPALTTNAERINFNWSEASVFKGFQPGGYSVRLNGCLEILKESRIEFVLGSDDGSKLIIDGREVISMWKVQGFTVENKTVVLKTGTHLIQVDYFQGDGSSSLNLKAGINGKKAKELSAEIITLPVSIKGQVSCP